MGSDSSSPKLTGSGRARASREPRRLTPEWYENAALRYLERYAASSAHLRRILQRKAARAAGAAFDPAESEREIQALLARLAALRLLDDRAYAAQLAAGLRRRGASRFGIRGKLALKGVDGALIATAIQELEAEGLASDLMAAGALARRRRLGPYRPEARRADFRDKDLAALARAGFDIDTARRVLAAADSEALERMIEEERTARTV